MQRRIAKNIQKVKFYSILADEGTDSSNKEQLPLVLRYVDPDKLEAREDFVAFLECDEGTSGRA